MKRRYHLFAINDRTGYREQLTATPCTHTEGCTMMRRFNLRPHVRLLLVEV